MSKTPEKICLLNSLLKFFGYEYKINKEFSFYKGSCFIKDKNSEEYYFKIMNKIPKQLELNKILIFSDLQQIYPSLYGLFSQNFTCKENKKYAKIIGRYNNYFSFVNNEFKCIILMDKSELEKCEDKFLNFFEKHIISFENLLSQDFIKMAKDTYNDIYNLLKLYLNENKIEDKNILINLLINCNEETIKGITYYEYYEYKIIGKKLFLEDLYYIILEKIGLILQNDIIDFLKKSNFKKDIKTMADKIIKFYQRGEHSNIVNFIEKMRNIKNVIYTYTNIEKILFR